MESRTQGSRPRPKIQKNSRPRTALPRTDTLEAKDRNARGQGQVPRTQTHVLSKKKRLQNFFQAISEKRGLQKFVSGDLQKKNGVEIKFLADLQNFNHSKNNLSSSRGEGSFRGLEASRPRPRTSKCVLEAKDVLKDSTFGGNTYNNHLKGLIIFQNKPVKILAGGQRQDHVTPFYHRLQIFKLKDLYKYEVAKLMHKNSRKKLPNRLNCHFIPVRAIHTQTTRLALSELNLYLSRYRPQKLQKSFEYQGAKIWNSVSYELTKLGTIRSV